MKQNKGPKLRENQGATWPPMMVWLVSFALASITTTGCKTQYVLKDAQVKHTQVSKSNVADPKMQTLLSPYRKRVDSIMAIPLATAAHDLGKQPGENLLGNAFTDLLLKSGVRWAQANGQSVPTLALLANGGLRVPIAKGPISMGTMFELMPFENEVVILTLSGSTIRQIAETQAKYRNLNLAGATIVVSKGVVTSVLISGQPLDPTGVYQLVTIDYLADGGDNMACLSKAKKRISTGDKLRDAFVQELKLMDKAGTPLGSKLEGRYQEQ
jgi:2',3'-cyclic-nucleotide 2'-phosphodiesterase (5'-nucleotidase family)